MRTFVFLTHPLNKQQLRQFWPITGVFPGLVRFLLKPEAPFRVLRWKNIRSAQGQEIQGYLLILPFLAQQIRDLGEEWALEKILAAGQLAERLDASLLGLGGYLSVSTNNQSYVLAKKLRVPLTSGNTFTAWSIIEAIHRSAKIKGLDLKESSVAVIGANGCIGNLCAKKISEYVSRIALVDQDQAKLERLREAILHLRSIEVVITEATQGILKEVDIVVNASPFQEPLFDLDNLKPNAIIGDLSYSAISDQRKARQDITVIPGGLVKLPYPQRRALLPGLPKDIIYASLAETMLLTFEEKFVSYSCGENINPDQLEEIGDIAVQHGFEVWVKED